LATNQEISERFIPQHVPKSVSCLVEQFLSMGKKQQAGPDSRVWLTLVVERRD